MQLSIAAILPSLCWAAVQIVTLPEPDHVPVTLEPTTARLVLAQRLGVEAYHSADLSDNVNAINEFGLREPLFSDRKDTESKRFYLVENAGKNVQGKLITVSSSPSVGSARGLYLDLIRQALSIDFSSVSDDELTSRLPTSGDFEFAIFASEKELASHIDSLPKKDGLSATIIYTSTTENDKEESWGSYELPGVQSLLRKRLFPSELPLEFAPEAVKAHAAATSSVSKPSNTSAPLRGILPACYNSESACASATRNCTGHGSCKLKYEDKTANGGRKCYACECSVQVTKNADGHTKTTRWGGPACQKKDISTEFWLIALFTVGLVFVVGFAIGEVWSMGSQELPSVIGAGVSGPVKRS